MKILSILLMTIIATMAQAELFKWKDAEGNIIYSDQPPPGENKAESKIEEESLPQIIAIPSENASSDRETNSANNENQQSKNRNLLIVSPKHDEAIRENSGNVSISLQVEPINFAENGSIVAVYMDGIEVARGADTTILLLNVDRGTHTLKAELINSSGNVVLATRPTTFHLQRFHN